jgi:hypothetical protein
MLFDDENPILLTGLKMIRGAMMTQQRLALVCSCAGMEYQTGLVI